MATHEVPEQRQPQTAEPPAGKTFRELLAEYADWRVSRMHDPVDTGNELHSVGKIALNVETDPYSAEMDK